MYYENCTFLTKNPPRECQTSCVRKSNIYKRTDNIPIVFYSSLSSICVFHKCENKTVKSSKSLRCRSRYLTAKCYRRHVEHWTHFFFLFTGRWAFLKKKPEEPNEKKFQDVVPIIFTLNFQQGKDVITWMLVRRAAAGKKKEKRGLRLVIELIWCKTNCWYSNT